MRKIMKYEKKERNDKENRNYENTDDNPSYVTILIKMILDQ